VTCCVCEVGVCTIGVNSAFFSPHT
jgi:hypothetical protein